MDVAEYLALFCWVTWCCFAIWFQISKMTGGDPAGPSGLRSGLRSSLRSSLRPPLRPSGPTGSPHVIFQIWTSITKNIMLLSKKMWDTQPNPRYSAKNNDAIRMIASFMQTHYCISYLVFLFYYSHHLRSETSLSFSSIIHTILDLKLYLTMDPTITDFLSTGPVHATARSHRAAAKGFSAFLTLKKEREEK